MYPEEEERQDVGPPPIESSGQADDELLTPKAAQDPSQPFRDTKDDGEPTPIEWKTLREAPEIQPQGPLSEMPAPSMPQAGASDITLNQRAEGARETGGFDWSRGFWAAGGGDLGSFDAERNRQRNQPFEDQLNQEKLNEFSLKKQAARDAIDPGSNTSMAAQNEFIDMMKGRANQLREMGKGTLAAEFDAWAQRAPKMHAVQIANAMKSPRMSEVLRAVDSQSRNDLAAANLGLKGQQLASAVADQGADNSRQWAQLTEQQRHNMAQEEHAKNTENKAEVKLTKAQQEKLNQEIGDLTVASKNMEELLETKKNVNTGPLAGRVQQLLSKVDMAPDDFVKLRALGARVFNKETKTLAGSAVSPAEWARIQPQIPEDTDDDATYARKMKIALDVTKQILAQRKKQYQMLNGKPVDRSVTAQENAPRVLSEQDQKALEWANQNPDDPRAAAIKKKLGVE